MMEIYKRSIGCQVNLCNCHCLLGQSVASLPPRSPRASTRSRHHFSFNKALSMDNSHSHNHHSELLGIGIGFSTSSSRHSSGGVSSVSGQEIQSQSGSQSASWDHSVGNHTNTNTSTNPNLPASHRDHTSSHVNTSSSSRTARSSLSEMESFSEADENNKLLEEYLAAEEVANTNMSASGSVSVSASGSNSEQQEETETEESARSLLLPSSSVDQDQDKSSAGQCLVSSGRGGRVRYSSNSGNSDGGSGSGSNANLSSENMSNNNQDQMSMSPPASSISTTSTITQNQSPSPHEAIQKQSSLGHHQNATDILNKRDSHSYHFKRKYNFRSDSVFSDVMPMPNSSSQESNTPKSPGPEVREKSGSLSSLKGQGSKWASLRKKLGRLNSSSSDKHGSKALEHQAHRHQQHHLAKSAKSSLEEKRSLLQRAKTLSILPVNRGLKEEVIKKPKEVTKPPELFNVGGEMNMIPLEFLIDINDLKISQ